MDDQFEQSEFEEIKVPVWRRALQVSVGFVFLLGILYLYNFSQFFIFQETPREASPREYASVVEGEELRVPVKMYLLNPKAGAEEKAGDMLSDAELIWGQANIKFDLEEVEEISLSPKEKIQVESDPQNILRFADVDPNILNIFLTQHLSGLNGVAYSGASTIFVAEFVSHFDFRTLAHEIGHVFGLPHKADQGSLMSQGSFGERLSEEEVLGARQRALRFRIEE